MGKANFWEHKSLFNMSLAEWEALCDGCAKCCLDKLEDEDTGEIRYTEVACRLLDLETCRCTDYKNRKRFVPECVTITPESLPKIHWMPPTCAYVLIARGKDLAPWHPLVTGDPATVHLAGMSARGRVVSEIEAGDLEDHVVTWPEQS